MLGAITGAVESAPRLVIIVEARVGDKDQNARYDVCLTFAGADRRYVKQVVKHLRAFGVTYFYDYELHTEVELWGKNLFQHLDHVYRVAALCCVVFVSEAYTTARWPSHELRSAQARAFTQAREYILLARFDDTDIPGLLPVDGYVDLRRKSPEQFAMMIAMKVARLRQVAGDLSVDTAVAGRQARWHWPVGIASALAVAVLALLGIMQSLGESDQHGPGPTSALAEDVDVELSCVEQGCVSRGGRVTFQAEVSGTVPRDKEILLIHYSVGDRAWWVISPIVPDRNGLWAATQTLGNPKPQDKERLFNTCAALLPLADASILRAKESRIGEEELPNSMVRLACVSSRRPPMD